MTLTRVWTPSGNHSGGGDKDKLVIHTMEGFTGPNGAYDCAKYFQSDCGASSQVCIDNNRGKIWECVARYNGAWTQCNYNSVSISCEQSGYASWSRSYWLDNRENQLRNIADWLAEESRATGIPLVHLSSSSAQGSGRGVCYHSELGSTGCGHSDPGSGFPLDVVLEWAKGGSAPSQPQPPTAETLTVIQAFRR
jgi:N-acetylmuramoyl-L-alanine amidase